MIRAIVNDDGLEQPVPWQLVQYAPDLPALVPCRDHDRDDRLAHVAWCVLSHRGHRSPWGVATSGADGASRQPAIGASRGLSRASYDPCVQRTVRRTFFALPVGLLLALLLVFYSRGSFATDTLTYLAAGERLNAGHALYSLSPGDRPVYLLPPFWTVPLVSPPPIAVLWRPLALMPAEAGRWLWWVLNMATCAMAIVMLGRLRPLLTAGAMLVLLLPTGYEMAVGNVNGFLLLGLVVTWRCYVRGDDQSAGVVTALMTAVKLTPAVAVWWLLVAGRTKAVVSAATVLIGVLALSLVGAGLASNLDYIGILTSRSAIGIYPGSLAGLASGMGVPDAAARLAPTLAAGVGLGAVWLLRHRPTMAFTVTIGTMILGSPAVNINWLVLLYALLAPLAWPIPNDQRVQTSGAPTVGGALSS